MSTNPCFSTRARGKLLLTGEYFVLDGALSLALPVHYGQSLEVESAPEQLHWRSLDPDRSVWFEALFALPSLEVISTTDENIASSLADILTACRIQKPGFLLDNAGYSVVTHNDFPRQWGLGTSSTLIAALAQWTGADPYPVLFQTLGGSGYDLACAYAKGPILYQLNQGNPSIQSADFQPAFASQLYFVYLDKKQNSRAGIEKYRRQGQKNQDVIRQISTLTERCLSVDRLSEFERIITEHERIVSQMLTLPRAKDLFFRDYWGEVKSLGAWGGDFVLVTSERTAAETRAFFNERGFRVFIPYEEMTDLSGRDSGRKFELL